MWTDDYTSIVALLDDKVVHKVRALLSRLPAIMGGWTSWRPGSSGG
jgi:hypothetical protein